LADEVTDMRQLLPFDVVRENFLAAARLGLDAQIRWLDGKPQPARKLLRDTLIPGARDGLAAAGIEPEDSGRYLDIIEERVSRRQTGSQWMLGSLAALEDNGTLAERLACITAATYNRQQRGLPVHRWSLADPAEARRGRGLFDRISCLMTTDLFTVHEDDVIDLVANLMDWKHIRHIPVEDDKHRLVGLVTHRGLLRTLTRRQDSVADQEPARPIAVREVMENHTVTCRPDTPTLEAMALMKQNGVACLPVVEDGRLVGIVSERDFMRIAGELLETFLDR